MGLFKDVVAEEYDLDGLDTEQVSDQITFDEEKESGDRLSFPVNQNQRPPYMINTICERDEEHDQEDSDSESNIKQESDEEKFQV